MQLKTRVTVLLLIAAISLLLFAGAWGWQRDNELTDRYHQVVLQSQAIAWNKLENESRNNLETTLTEVLGRADVAHAWAEHDYEALDTLMEPILDRHPGWRADWFDARRVLAHSSSTALLQQPMVDTGWLARALASNQTQTGLSQSSRERYYLVALRRFGPENAPGVLALGQNLGHLLPEMNRTITGESFIINLRGQGIAGTLPGVVNEEDLSLTARRPSIAEISAPGGRQWLTATMPLEGPNHRPVGAILTAWDITDQEGAEQWIDLLAMGGAATFLAVLGWAVFVYLRRALRPLERSVRVLDQLAKGDLRATPDEDDQALPDEAGQIARSVAALRDEMFNLQMLRDERSRTHQQQERLIRGQLRQLAETLDEEARAEVLTALEPQEAETSRTDNSLVKLAGVLGRMSDLVTTQQHRLVGLLHKLREAMAQQATLISLQQELEIARTMQLSILPRSAPPTQAVAVSALMVPAKEVGGDFYDYFLMRDGRLAMVVADVSGKGIPAAFFMAISRTLLKNIAQFLQDPADIIDRLNKQLCAENEQMMFVTVFLCLLDLKTGQLDYVNAGHNPPLLLRADGAVETMPRGKNMALAVMDDFEFKPGRTQLNPGDTLLLYTDGVTEAANPEGHFFGEARLTELVSQYKPGSGNLPEALLEAVREFEAGAQQTDDITCVTTKFLG
ncbi:SpoIIE family protein phosphatase [Ottowia thiooxydans]|uniref:SpoIIE family protein phosphatase n=1 Tax=Ottowia thiooxydans TaxID=219182 RepID=UPI0003F9DFAB|nr:SpoIIE family protein phosphatase [Ottowia thiooxydans]